jgi:putative two-component system response regulator
LAFAGTYFDPLNGMDNWREETQSRPRCRSALRAIMYRPDATTPRCPHCGRPEIVYKAQTLATLIYECRACREIVTETRPSAAPGPHMTESIREYFGRRGGDSPGCGGTYTDRRPARTNNHTESGPTESLVFGNRASLKTLSDQPLSNPAVVLVADDSEDARRTTADMLKRYGYQPIEAADGAHALDQIQNVRPDLVISDVVMPHLDGFELCRRMKADPATRLIPVILLTGLHARKDRLEGIDAGADDFLTKPFDGLELRARAASLVRLKRFTDELDSAEAVILQLALTVEARDAGTGGHCQRMASLAVSFGRYLGLGEDDLGALRRGGYLHDLGKIAVPDAVLLKRGRLTPEEFDVIKRHPATGEALCGELRVLSRVRPIIRHHHERWDGRGYPDGLQGGAIPLLAQVMAVVDIYDALTTHRSYREAYSPAQARTELEREAANGWRDPGLVNAFLQFASDGV